MIRVIRVLPLVILGLPSMPAESASAAQGGGAGIEWVFVPGGSIMLGTEESTDDVPPHRVTVRSFQLAKTLVTNRQYRACVDAGVCTPAHVSDGTCAIYDERLILGPLLLGDDQPVVCVDWDQARIFSEWAGGRLPSVAEWRYAESKKLRPLTYRLTGDPKADKIGLARVQAENLKRMNEHEGSYFADMWQPCDGRGTPRVCSKSYGKRMEGRLCDMTGIAYQWLQDWHHDSYEGAPNDGRAWEDPPGSYRCLVGIQSWCNIRIPSSRPYVGGACQGGHPKTRTDELGFRPAR